MRESKDLTALDESLRIEAVETAKDYRQLMEPGAAPISDRLQALKNLHDKNLNLRSPDGILNKILDWENKPAPEKIKSMSGDVQQGNVDERFKQRAPLPTIFEVVK